MITAHKRPGRRRRAYPTLYERVMANSRVVDEEDPDTCWEWTGSLRGGYPSMNVRVNGRVKHIAPHRVVLEALHRVTFPFDEGGHRCNNPLCVRPCHLEIQAPAHNKAERRGYTAKTGERWIPVLFPIVDPAQEAVDAYFDKCWDAPPPAGPTPLEAPF